MFVYALAPEPTFGPPACNFLSDRRKEVEGFMSSPVLSEVAHRLMTLEAVQRSRWPYAGIANRLKRHPREFSDSSEFRQSLSEIVAIGIHILPVNAQDILFAGDLSRQHGLLSGDALLLAMMQSHGLTQLASNDADFDRIPGITRFGPV